MAALRKTNDADLYSGSAFLSALVPTPSGVRTGQSAIAKFEGHQRTAISEAIPELTARLAAKKVVWPDTWQRVEVNRRRILNTKTGRVIPFIKDMTFGSRARFFGPDAEINLDMMPVLAWIQTELHKRSPVRPAYMSAHHLRGTYRRNHEIWYDNKKRSRLWRVGARGNINENAIGLVMNRTDYASVLETPDYKRHQTYQKVFRAAKRKFSKDWDVNLRFADPSPFGGTILTSRYKSSPTYAMPVITVGYLNALGGRAGQFSKTKRRVLSGRGTWRMNSVAQFRRSKLKIRG